MRISERFGDVLFLSIVAVSVCDVIPPGMTFFPARLRLSFSNKPTRITVYPSKNESTNSNILGILDHCRHPY